MAKIPGGSQVRAMLDPVSRDHFHPVFATALEHLRHSGGLSGFTCLSNHVLIALDGTEHHRSAKGGPWPPARPAVAAGVRGAAG